MKKILYSILLILFFASFMQAQTAYYELNVNGYIGWAGGSTCGSSNGLHAIAIIYENKPSDQEDNLDNYYTPYTLWESDYQTPPFRFTENDIKPKQLHFHTNRRKRPGCRSDRKNYFYTLPSFCFEDQFDFNVFSNFPGYANVSVKPFITLPSPGVANTFGTHQPLNVPSVPGINLSFYNWEYSKDGGTTWSLFPTNHQNQDNLTVMGSEFLTDQDHGKDIYIRVNTGCNFSNVIIYKYLLSAPDILSSTPLLTSCFDTEDGSAKIQFDRPLKEGELLSISLQNTTNGLDYSVENITDLDANNSYTVTGLPIGNYQASLLGFYNGFNTYVEGAAHNSSFAIDRPVPIEFTTSKVDVWCNGGTDGEIMIETQGGVGNFEYALRTQGDTAENWQNFSGTGTHTITELAPNIYEILIRDGNGCYAKEIVRDGAGNIVGLGNIIVRTIEITEPENPVAINYVFSQEPTGYGLSNGIIRAQVTGGTPFTGGSYDYTWVYEDGTVWTDITEEVITDQGYFLTLNGAPAGIYTLTVSDANYNNATNKEGCTVGQLEFELTQPNPLEVTLSVHHEISCHQNNEFGNETDVLPEDGQRDESQDGALIASVTGGVPFTTGEPYLYTWKKQNTDGSWQTLENQIQNIADLLSDGNYAFNVEDANGNILGIYENNVLTQAIDSTFYLHEPSKLELSLSTTPTSCASGSDGSVTATVTGGTPPYTYYWSNGTVGNISTIENVSPNNYFVQIIDEKGCQIQGSIEVAQPEDYFIELVELKHPSCYNGNDGEIDLSIQGGTAPYTINWSTGETMEDIENLGQGEYSVSITDASGCTLFQEFVLENPEEITIDLGEDRTLCNGQSMLLDASVEDSNATYQWTSDNEFNATGAQVTVSQAGTYRVVVTTSLGCVVEDKIIITTSNEDIGSEFLLSSQAYVGEEVILVNISNPKGATTQWIVPSEVTINEQDEDNIKLVFPQVGTYEIGLRSTQGECYEEFYKNIVVEESSELADPGDADNPFIQEFTLAPNPNDGNFEIRIELAEISPISIRIFNMLGEQFVATRVASGSKEYTLFYSEFLPSGVYLVVLETAKGTKVKKMIRL